MKKICNCLFISLAFISLAVGVNLMSPKAKMVKADPEYQFIDKTNGIDFVSTANNAIAELTTISYSVQTGDYLAIDIEGSSPVIKLGLNGALVSEGSDYTNLTTNHCYSNWTAEMKYGRWTLISSGRGIFYVPLSEYFSSVSTITSLKINFADNKTESFTIHNVFIANSTDASNGTALLDVFNVDGSINSTKITLTDANATARKSARGFKNNQALIGGVVIDAAKTHIEIPVSADVTADGGYFAYDISFGGGFIYFKTSYTNTSDVVFNASYTVGGKSISKDSQTVYDELTTKYSWFYYENGTALKGSVFEDVGDSTGKLKKIIIDCDNLSGGSQLFISNFYYISKDLSTVTKLVDFASMSDEDFATNVSVTINSVASSAVRIDVIQNWIGNYMYLGDSRFNGEGTGLCSSGGYYLDAKVALAGVESSNPGSIAKFQNNTGGHYTAALSRFNAWASACGDSTPFDGKTTISGRYTFTNLNETQNSFGTIVILIVVVATCGGLFAYFVLRKRNDN